MPNGTGSAATSLQLQVHGVDGEIVRIVAVALD